MADTSVSYKCPHCDAPLSFQPGNEKVTCEYCGTELEISAVEDLFQKKQEMAAKAQAAKEAKWDTEAAGGEWSEDEAAAMRTFTCSSCGAEIVADENTMATECCYCGNPTMLPQRFTGMLRPDYVIPFKKTKEEAVAALTAFAKGKRLLPDSFIRDRRFEKIQGMYVPFWLFSADVYAEGRFECTKVRTYSSGSDDVTETSHYRCACAAQAGFHNVPADGSVKMNDTYMEAVEPFDYSEMVPFSMAYMAGYLADKYDVDAEASMSRADARIETTMIAAMRGELSGDYASVDLEESRMEKANGVVAYALAPVWILSTRYRDKIYTFMMNGQTGKFIGTLPSDEGKQRKYMAIAFAAILVLNYFLSGVHFYVPFVLLVIVAIYFGVEGMSFRKFLKDAKERGDNL